MAYVYFDSKYALAGFLIVPDGGDPYDEGTTTLVQTDWDYPSVARSMGWTCPEDTDGTVDSPSTGLTANQMIADAFSWIETHEGESFEELDDYLPGSDYFPVEEPVGESKNLMRNLIDDISRAIDPKRLSEGSSKPKKIKEFEKGDKKAKVYSENEDGEWVVKFYDKKDGEWVYNSNADHFGDSKEDAIGTAKMELGLNESRRLRETSDSFPDLDNEDEVEEFLNREIEVTKIRSGFVARPKGQLGTIGWYPYPWEAVWGRTKEKAIRNFKERYREDIINTLRESNSKLKESRRLREGVGNYDLDEFVHHYIGAILFFESANMGDDSDGTNMLDYLTDTNSSGVHYMGDEPIFDEAMNFISGEMMQRVKKDCHYFLTQADNLGVELDVEMLQQAAHDFYLTRQGHGSGFWDRDDETYGSSEIRDSLNEIAKNFGETWFYIGDDGMVYQS